MIYNDLYLKQIKGSDGRDRSEILGEYLVRTGSTVRCAAAEFGISKSTVHKDVSTRLAKINHGLYEEVKEVLEKNKSERHLRGGQATKKKYMSHIRQEVR